MNYIDITSPDINNGLGCRVTLWVSGCLHHCVGCHNPESWDFNFGKTYDKQAEDKIIEQLNKPYIKGLTLSGGDPLSQNTEGLNLLRALIVRMRAELPGKDIWIYSGDTYENLILDTVKKTILDFCDVLVDGKYDAFKRDIRLPFRGSTNQRIIDLNKTRKTNKIKLLNIENYDKS